MRLLFLLAVLLLFDAFVFQAFALISADWSSAAQYLTYGLYWAIPLAAIGMGMLFMWGDIRKWDRQSLILGRAGLMTAYFAKFLIAILLLADGLRSLLVNLVNAIAGNLVFDPGRSEVMIYLAVGTGLMAFSILIYGILRNRHRYKVFAEEVSISGLPSSLEGLRIVQISDIHSGSFTLKEPLERAIEIINAQNADLVFFTGDLVNSVAAEMESFIDVFNKISARFGVYSIVGNHDYGDYIRWENQEDKKQNFERLKEIHGLLGWDLMLNEHRLLEVNGEQVAVIGVENYSANQRFHKYGDLEKAYAGTADAKLKLLLSHDPSHWDDEVTTRFKDIALTFSGHTHGMQFGIEIPGWLSWSPAKYIYKQWAGLYQNDQQFLYVNRGFGYLGYPGRVGILPEITLIELKQEK